MAIAFDASAVGSGVNASSKTWSHTCTGSNLILFVSILTGGGDTMTGVTYAGSSMTQVSKLEMAAGNWIYLYYIVAPSTGANNVVASQTGSGYIQCASASYTGANQTGQPDASTSSYNPSTSSLTTTVTTIADNCWLVEAGRCMDTSSIGAGTDTTLRVGDYLSCILDSNGARTPAGSQSLVFTGTGRMGAVMASFSPVSVGTTFTPKQTMII